MAKNIPATKKDSPAITLGKAKNAKPATTYAMNGTSVKDGESPFETYVTEKSAKEANLTDPVPNGVSYAVSKIKNVGVETRGNGAATKGRKAYGPLA
jgi:hypothetical protein